MTRLKKTKLAGTFLIVSSFVPLCVAGNMGQDAFGTALPISGSIFILGLVVFMVGRFGD